jgi:catecholate siderophore receptor
MAFKKTPLALLAALAVQHFGVHGQALAQSAPPTRLKEIEVSASRALEPTYNPPTSSTGLKIEAPLRDTPQTINVVPQQVLRDQAAGSMEDVLRTVPGVGLSHGDGQRDQVTIRGYSSITDQFIDGMRDDALYFRDLSNIEQVEVIKGPASVLYGRGSSGGLINRISKKPGIDKTELSLKLGSWERRRGEFDIARLDAASGAGVRITGALERANSYRDQQFLEREAFAPTFSFKLGEQTRLLVGGEYLSDRRVTDFGVPAYRGRPLDVDPGAYYGSAQARDLDYSQARVSAVSFALEHRFNAQWSVRNALRDYHYTLNRNNTLVGAVNESALSASLNRSNVRRDEQGWFNQTELTLKASLGGMAHQILYGVEIGKQDKDQLFRTRNNIATVALFNPVLPVLPLDVNVAPSTDNTGITKVTSAYVQDLVSLSAQWKALAGVRYDRFEQQTLERRVGQPNLQRTDREWSPRAGLVYQPTLNQSWYASFSKSFQPSGESFALAANNAQIAPEKTTSKEAGARFDFLEGALSATASLFRLERSNIKATDPATNRLVPIGTQRTDGLELALTGELPQGWQVWGGYSYLDGRITASPAVDAGQRVQGKRPTLTPEHSANLWISKALGNGLGAGAGTTSAGQRWANPGNTVVLPGFVTFDAMAWYRVDSVELQLNVRNLADRRYYVAGHGSAPNLNLPGAPRNVQLTARYMF